MDSLTLTGTLSRTAGKPAAIWCIVDDRLIDALFASDLAQDVRAEFNARRQEGMSVNDATSACVVAFRHLLERPDDGPIVIVAIAALQLRDGALSATFRDAAIDLLRDGHGFEKRPGEMLSAREDRETLRTSLIAELTDAHTIEES